MGLLICILPIALLCRSWDESLENPPSMEIDGFWRGAVGCVSVALVSLGVPVLWQVIPLQLSILPVHYVRHLVGRTKKQGDVS